MGTCQPQVTRAACTAVSVLCATCMRRLQEEACKLRKWQAACGGRASAPLLGACDPPCAPDPCDLVPAFLPRSPSRMYAGACGQPEHCSPQAQLAYAKAAAAGCREGGRRAARKAACRGVDYDAWHEDLSARLSGTLDRLSSVVSPRRC